MTPLEKYVGEILDDKYRLERLLGKGGMGAVYLATHLGTDRYVALKLIAPQFMRNEEFVERFKREARAAGRLRHPNVVDVTDFGFSGSGPDRVAYLIMEYLDGCTLSDVLAEETRLPLYWVVDILEQVCSAVHEAHQQGVVHRDLKPDNIWLEPNGLGGYRVKVLDFGIAKLGEAAPLDLDLFPPVRIDDEAVTQIPLQEPIAATAAAGGGESETLISQAAGAPATLEAATLIQPADEIEAPSADN
ncbi:MAG TPA: serine/threonine-protein kinase, partial [Pyrinomonadaceae bacterium]|nr:serine/threonine-protein kinase [Pyrinomonadaceae bacterium]